MKKGKFRAWDKKNKKWIDDTDIAINQKRDLFIRHEHQVEFTSMSLTKSANYELFFSTSFKDKDDNEIYEGDVVRRWYGCGRDDFNDIEVYMGNEFGDFIVRKTYIERKKEKTILFNERWESKDCEIIGNVHNNPELLKI